MIHHVRLVYDAADTFLSHQLREPSTRGSVAVVVGTIVSTVLSQLVLLAFVLSDGWFVLTSGLYGVVVEWTIRTVGSWFVFAGVLQAFSALFDRDGSFEQLLVLLGWGYLPLCVAGVVLTVVTVVVGVVNPGGTAATVANLPAGVTAFRASPLFMLVGVGTNVLFGVSVLVWAVILSRARAIRLGHSLALVIPSAVAVFGFFYGIL
ncbi:YIP1 family protein [Halocatena halophila]|uniref:YIP1 family protein n=1 Tax=Halocatena halophila TaxID=2814576 RepID=UPI002ED018FE